MPVIYYRSKVNEASERLQKIMEREILKGAIESYKSLDELSQRLRQMNQEKNVVVLLIDKISEIFHVCSIKKSIYEIRIILILPDRSPETVSAGHKLHPRFISYADSDFKDVAVVLKRMIRLTNRLESAP